MDTRELRRQILAGELSPAGLKVCLTDVLDELDATRAQAGRAEMAEIQLKEMTQTVKLLHAELDHVRAHLASTILVLKNFRELVLGG